MSLDSFARNNVDIGCDIAERCDGISLGCGVDRYKTTTPKQLDSCRILKNFTFFFSMISVVTGGTICRTATGPCDAAEVCTGDRFAFSFLY